MRGSCPSKIMSSFALGTIVALGYLGGTMQLSGQRLWVMALVFWGGLAGLSPWVQACQTPVFRYALERWKPSVYPLLIFHRGPLTPPQQTILAGLRHVVETQKLANVAVRLVDVAATMPAGVESVWKAQTNASLPWVVLRYPDTEADAPSAWAGPLTAQNLERLLDSPLRRAVARGLAAGHAAVWILLESGQSSADERAAALLDQELKRAHRRIELAADPDAPENTNLTLEVSFQWLRSPRQAAEEEIFVHTLLSVEPELATRKTPIVVPVFGRGRALCALPETQITPAVLREAIEFLTGACSCEVKELNPGLDVLMSANWEEVAGANRYSEPPPPQLLGLGGLVEKTNAPAAPLEAVGGTSDSPAEPPAAPKRVLRMVWLTGGGLLAMLALATWWVTRRAK